MYWGEKAMLRNKNVVKLVSLAFAIILWVYVVAVENPPTKVKVSNIPVTIVNAESLSQRGLALNSEDGYFMDIVIQGTRSDVLSVSAEDIVATADVFGYNEGEHYIPVNVTVPNYVSVAEQKTNSITVRIEPLASVYKDLYVEFVGKVGDKQEPTVFQTLPEEIEVKGAKSRVAQVKQVKAVLNTESLTKDKQSFSVELSAVDANGNEVKHVHLSSRTATIEAAVYEMKEVPLKVNIKGEVDSIYEVSQMAVPEKIKIKGLHKDLKGIDSIKAKDVDLSGIVGTTEIPLELDMPEGIFLAQESEHVAINVVIKGIGVKQFEVLGTDVAMTNVDEGLFSAVNSESVIVKVSAKEEFIDDVTLESLNIRVDLKDLKEGLHVVPILVDQTEEMVKVVVEPAQVNVTISKTQ